MTSTEITTIVINLKIWKSHSLALVSFQLLYTNLFLLYFILIELISEKFYYPYNIDEEIKAKNDEIACHTTCNYTEITEQNSSYLESN